MDEAPLPPEIINALVNNPAGRIHFVGIAGSGISAYAAYRALSGGKVSGSDRLFDTGAQADLKKQFEKIGIQIFPQDGSGVYGADAVVASVSIESDIADIRQAARYQIPVISRRDWLAAYYRTRRAVAITGTSGKSTVTAMVFEILQAARQSPGLMTGAALVSLQGMGHLGNAWAGEGPLVLEADESDKGIQYYAAEVGAILNLQRDHDEPAAMLPVLQAFKGNCRKICVISDDPALESLRPGAVMVGESPACQRRITDIKLDRDGSTFRYHGAEVMLPIPGHHNVCNAAMALAVAEQLGVEAAVGIRTLAFYQGTARRFQIVGRARRVEVIDDYAHNPDKIRAVLRAATMRTDRLLIYFQPHGFGPTRFMRPDLVKAFASELRADDRLFLAPIYYAGGTVAQDISSEDLAADIVQQGRSATVAKTRQEFCTEIGKVAQAGDVVLILGARDATLNDLARDALKTLRRPSVRSLFRSLVMPARKAAR